MTQMSCFLGEKVPAAAAKYALHPLSQNVELFSTLISSNAWKKYFCKSSDKNNFCS